jgi:hypothetical protein
MSTDYYPPTQGTDLQSAHLNNQNWLPIELERELEAAAPGPNDIDENGFVVNLDRLEEVATKLFPRGRLFYNWYQAKDFHNKLGSMWGYVGSTEGNTMFCSFGKADKKKRKSDVSPSIQRTPATSIKEIGCPWKIKFNQLGGRRIDSPVKITNVVSLAHTCKPGKSSLTIAKKSAGQYVLSQQAVEALLTFIDSGPVPPSTLRQFVRRYVPAQVEISSQDLFNLRKRALFLKMTNKDLKA